MMFRFLEKRSTQNLILYGLALGLAVMDRATLAVTPLPFLILSKNSFSFLHYTRNIIALLIITCFVNIPWMIRNFQKDHVVGFASSGRDLWKGSISESEGSNYLNTGLNYYSALTLEEIKYCGQLTPAEQNEFFVGKFMKNVNDDPSGYLKLYFVKLKNFWIYRTLIGNEYPSFIQPFIPVYKSLYLTILILSLISCFLFRKAWMVMTMPAALSIFHAFFYVETRHRLLIEPLLIFLAVVAATEIYSFLKKSGSNTLEKY